MKDCRVFIPGVPPVARDQQGTGNNNNKGNAGGQAIGNACFKCGRTGHMKRDCPEMQNGQGNGGGNDDRGGRGRAFMLGKKDEE